MKIPETIQYGIGVERQFLERLAVFDPEFDSALFGFGSDLFKRGLGIFEERFFFSMRLSRSLG